VEYSSRRSTAEVLRASFHLSCAKSRMIGAPHATQVVRFKKEVSVINKPGRSSEKSHSTDMHTGANICLCNGTTHFLHLCAVSTALPSNLMLILLTSLRSGYAELPVAKNKLTVLRKVRLPSDGRFLPNTPDRFRPWAATRALRVHGVPLLLEHKTAQLSGLRLSCST
jgi:hypothetical protein